MMQYLIIKFCSMMSTTFITTFITTFTTTLSQNFHHNFHHNSFITTLSQNFHHNFHHNIHHNSFTKLSHKFQALSNLYRNISFTNYERYSFQQLSDRYFITKLSQILRQYSLSQHSSTTFKVTDY